MKPWTIVFLLLLFPNSVEAKDFLASCCRSTSDIVVERKNEIQWEREREWRKYAFDKTGNLK